jgi:predicted DNA-binding protein with PD1-like motif
MRYTEGSTGRIFLIKFEHGDDLLAKVKELAVKEDVKLATITFIGALSKGDIVAGPDKLELPAVPTWISFADGREVLGSGTIIKEKDEVHTHIHSTLGRGKEVLTGCLRKDCQVFVTVEAVVTEIKGINVSRLKDKDTGCNVLEFGR